MSAHPANQSPQLPLTDNGVATTGTTAPAPRRSRLRLVPLVMASLFTGAVVGMYFQPPALKAFFAVTGLEPGAGTDTPIAIATRKVIAQEEVAVVSEGDIVALGRVLPQGDVISIAPPFGAGDARIAELLVAVGDVVQPGDVLAVLDNRDQLQSAVEGARATVAIREATLQQTRAAIATSRAEAQAALERSEATLARAEADLSRMTVLNDRGATTRADFDQAVAQAAEAKLDVAGNRATLSRFDPSSGPAQADIAVAEANLEAARVEVVRNERNLSQAIVVAPAQGTILAINSRVGERAGSDGILDMGDTSQMVVKAEVYQTLIGRVSVGNPVTMSAEALDADLTGVVDAIGLEIGRQSVTSDDPAANTDARVVEVTVRLDPSSSARASRLTNLETVVRIDAEPGA